MSRAHTLESGCLNSNSNSIPFLGGCPRASYLTSWCLSSCTYKKRTAALHPSHDCCETTHAHHDGTAQAKTRNSSWHVVRAQLRLAINTPFSRVVWVKRKWIFLANI